MARIIQIVLVMLGLAVATPAAAEVRLSFHSFNGSVVFGRYPHAFIVMEGELDATGEVIRENYGFSAKNVTPAILNGPVKHMIQVEKDKWLTKTNRHFTITLTDTQYAQVKALVEEWRNAPGKFYDLEKRNCIHFVGEIGKIVGLKVTYPSKMLRRPKKWLNHIAGLNPQLGAKMVR